MKKVKYFLLAHLIKLFLELGFLFSTIGLLLHLSLAMFSDKNYIEFKNFSLGHTGGGYPVNASLRLRIPDSVKTYVNGSYYAYHHVPYIKTDLDTTKLISATVNVFKTSGEKSNIYISNRIDIQEDVQMNVKSRDKFENFLLCIQSNLDLIYFGCICLILLKLTNCYINGDIFKARSFKLVTMLGFLLIAKEILMTISAVINTILIGNAYLVSTVTTAKGEKTINNLDITVDFLGSFGFSNVGIGILIVLLSQVIKEAVVAKIENSLTI